MSIRFNHTIVHSRDKKESATFLADILGLPATAPSARSSSSSSKTLRRSTSWTW